MALQNQPLPMSIPPSLFNVTTPLQMMAPLHTGGTGFTPHQAPIRPIMTGPGSFQSTMSNNHMMTPSTPPQLSSLNLDLSFGASANTAAPVAPKPVSSFG